MHLKLYSSLKSLSHVIFPNRCHYCGEEAAGEASFCASCYENLTFLSAYKCRYCGYEAEHLLGDICGVCLQQPPPFKGFYGVVKYDEFSASLITRLKFKDRLELVPTLAKLMIMELMEFDDGADVIMTAVPLHWRRRVKRRYNQSVELSRYIAKKKKLMYIPDLTQRIRATKPQIGQSGYQRQLNLKKAFRFNPKYQNIKRKQVILVDDVLTTGATSQAVAKILKKTGFEVYLLVFARVDGHLR